jgi:hypothetical protein
MTVIVKRRPEAAQRFPFIPLGRAIERARELYKVANSHEVPFTTAAKTWGYAEKSSGGVQTAAALKSFGLIEDVSGSDVRKVKLTDPALRIIRDPREISPDRDSLIREAALKPSLHREIIEKYSGMPPSEEALKAFLLIDRGLKDDAAPEFIREFAATMAFAKVAEVGTIQEKEPGVPATAPSPTSVPKVASPDVKIGNYVQWTSSGQEQFSPPRKVVWLSDDRTHVRVHGSNTGIPMAELTIVDAPKAATPSQSTSADKSEPPKADISVLQVGNRLEITANVDATGLAKLKEILAKYEEILKLL